MMKHYVRLACFVGGALFGLSLIHISCCGTIIRATREVNVICGDCREAFERESRKSGSRKGSR